MGYLTKQLPNAGIIGRRGRITKVTLLTALALLAPNMMMLTTIRVAWCVCLVVCFSGGANERCDVK